MFANLKWMSIAVLLLVVSTASAETYQVQGTVTIGQGYEDAQAYIVYYRNSDDMMIGLTNWRSLTLNPNYSGTILLDNSSYNVWMAVVLDVPTNPNGRYVVLNQQGTTTANFRLLEYTSPILE